MHNDDNLVRALIAGYKTCEAPSAATKARIQRALAAAQQEAPARVARIPARRTAAIPWLALAAGLVLLVGWRAGSPWTWSAGHVAGDRGALSSFAAATTDPGLAAANRAAPEPAPAPPVAADAADPTAPGPAPTPPAATDEPSDASAPQKHRPSPAERPPAGDGKRRKATRRPAAPVAADLADPVLAEMALLQRAQEALRAHRPAEALVLLDRYTEAFPRGSLVEERQALRIAALCAVGQSEQGLAAKAAFMRTYPRSAYAGRVVAACPDPPPQKPGGSRFP